MSEPLPEGAVVTILAREADEAFEVPPRRAAKWWVENRPVAPEATRVDFEEAKLLLARGPGVGAKSSGATAPDLRRLFLSRVSPDYYRIRPGKVAVHITHIKPGEVEAVMAQIGALGRRHRISALASGHRVTLGAG